MTAIGVDIVDIERIAQSIDRFGDRFLQRVFTEQELAYCNGRVDSLAARWAAKEACLKALRRPLGSIPLRDIEVIPNPEHGPVLQLHGRAQDALQAAGARTIHLSLSHEKDYAVAVVLVA